MEKFFDGDPSGLPEYEAWVKESYRTYLSMRAQSYGSVVRWPGSRFWKRRAAKETPRNT